MLKKEISLKINNKNKTTKTTTTTTTKGIIKTPKNNKTNS